MIINQSATSAMNVYTVLFVDFEDVVVRAEILQAKDHAQAYADAQHAAGYMPLIAGFQLWLGGKFVAGTVPQAKEQTAEPVPTVTPDANPADT